MTVQKFRLGQRVFVSPQSGFNGMGRESSFRLNDYEGKIARIIPIERDDRPIYVETFGNSDWFKAEELKLAAPVQDSPQLVPLREGEIAARLEALPTAEAVDYLLDLNRVIFSELTSARREALEMREALKPFADIWHESEARRFFSFGESLNEYTEKYLEACFQAAYKASQSVNPTEEK